MLRRGERVGGKRCQTNFINSIWTGGIVFKDDRFAVRCPDWIFGISRACIKAHKAFGARLEDIDSPAWIAIFIACAGNELAIRRPFGGIAAHLGWCERGVFIDVACFGDVKPPVAVGPAQLRPAYVFAVSRKRWRGDGVELAAAFLQIFFYGASKGVQINRRQMGAVSDFFTATGGGEPKGMAVWSDGWREIVITVYR